MDGYATRPLAPVAGLWDELEVFTPYRVTIQGTGLLVGGVPRDPQQLEAWLVRQLGADPKAELRLRLARLLEQEGLALPGDLTDPDAMLAFWREAAGRLARAGTGTTFWRDAHGLYLAGYQIKACLKEAAAIAYPYQAGHRLGPSRKSAKALVAESVFVAEDRVYLGRQEPDGTLVQPGVVRGPAGERAILQVADYVVQPRLTFHLLVLGDVLTPDQWRRILLVAGREGLGAMRSLSRGQFVVTDFAKLTPHEYHADLAGAIPAASGRAA